MAKPKMAKAGMVNTFRRKAAKKIASRASKPARKRDLTEFMDFCAAARDALKRGEPDAVSDKTLQQVLSAAVKVYAAKVERRGHDVAPFPQNTVTATETVVTACGMIRAADLNMFDVAIWFHRPPGIE
jgi:hypothetical protein